RTQSQEHREDERPFSSSLCSWLCVLCDSVVRSLSRFVVLPRFVLRLSGKARSRAMTEEDLFLRALDLPVAERPAFLGSACGRDDALRRRVEALLAAHDTPGSFLAGPAVAPATMAPPGPADPKLTAEHTAPTEEVGTRIGPYKLLQQLGEGGMG